MIASCGTFRASSPEPDAALEHALFTSPELGPAVAELLALVDTARSLGERGPIVPVLHPDQLTTLQATRSVVVATVGDAPYDPREGHILVCCERHVALAAADVRLCVEDAQGHIFTEARLLASPV